MLFLLRNLAAVAEGLFKQEAEEALHDVSF
jgi:hypothetical protein